MTFAEKLKSERKRIGLSQADLALLLGVSAEWVSKSERGLSTPLEITQEGALERLRKTKTTTK
jgi:transcriptional regulator with XRE-family HTH domain